MGLEGVSEAVVIGRPDPEGETRLIAYLVTDKGIDKSVSQVKDYLNQRLPDYMIPSHFYFLVEIPLTTSMKTDYGSLPDPGKERPNIDTPYLPPRSAVECKLSDIWSEILDVVPIGINDNFFDLGGHSLKIAQIVNKIQVEFGVDINIRQFFEASTILELAQVIMSNNHSDAKYSD